MDGGGSEGGGKEGRRRPRGEVDDDDDDDDGGPSPRTRHRRPLANVHGDDGTIGGLLEAHHK